MALTLKEAINELQFDNRPNGPDGCSNVDRIAFVLYIFGMDAIDLNADYDFTMVVSSDDENMVMAAKHLALLKLDLLHRLNNGGAITLHEYNSKSAMLILAVQRINWHLSHLQEGKPTPPFPSIH